MCVFFALAGLAQWLEPQLQTEGPGSVPVKGMLPQLQARSLTPAGWVHVGGSQYVSRRLKKEATVFEPRPLHSASSRGGNFL